jgi:hypothetical protein
MKNETSGPNIFCPFRAGPRVDVFLGLKPQAESFCPFGAETECVRELSVQKLRTRSPFRHPKPATRCNSDLAQYSHTPARNASRSDAGGPLLRVTGFEDDEDDDEAFTCQTPSSLCVPWPT